MKCQLAPWRSRWEWVDDGYSPPAYYERFARASCTPWKFKAGDSVVVVALLGPQFPGAHHGIELQHIFTRALFIPDDQKVVPLGIIPGITAPTLF